jgi:AraC-like DNA-binding protein
MRISFACPVRFGARHNRLFFRVEDIDQPFITYNPDLLEVIAPQLEAELKQHLTNKSLKEQAKGILKRSLAGQRPRLEEVAAELRMSARTLQRKLVEEGASFHILMEEARHEMAQHYLRQRSLELNETAYLLGYEDPNFVHSGLPQMGREIAGRVAIRSLGNNPISFAPTGPISAGTAPRKREEDRHE